MRYTFILSLLVSLTAYGQQVSNTAKDFGKVKDWNNPAFNITYTNTSGKQQLFLPVKYSVDLGVKIGKMKLQPGESTSIEFKYYTEEFGRFTKEIPIYVSTQGEPIVFTLKGNINSFHADAFTFCPRIDNRDLVTSPTFIHTIKVIDATTKEPLQDFNISIGTRTSKENIVSPKSTIELRREKPGFYTIEVGKENYELVRLDKYINRNTTETVIELVREYPDTNTTDDDFVFAERDTEVEQTTTQVDHPKEDEPNAVLDEEVQLEEETVVESTPEIKEKEQDTLEEEEIEEVVQEVKEEDTFDWNAVQEEPQDTADFKEDGKLNESKYAFNHIIFLIDASTSMKNPEKMPLLKESMKQMIQVLRAEDKVSIITYGNSANTLISNVSGADKELLGETIDALLARGQSYGQEGVDMAYKLARKYLIENGNNEIILASDGVFNSKNFSESKLYRKAAIRHAAYNIRISTIGFGNSSKALTFLETLAQKGNGSYLLIKDENEANKVLIENLMQHSVRK